MIDYTLVRSQRKTLAIHITKNATVEVRAPILMSENDINKFVQSKKNWIAEHLQTQTMRVKQKTESIMHYGDTALYRGKQYPIIATTGSRIGFDDVSFYMPENLNSKQIKYALTQIYKMLAKRDLTNRVIDFARLMNLSPTAVKINSANTRWGSCSNKNSINFSWRLILAEDAVIDYVVVHELSHIKEHNHSAQFWAVVKSILPDYKERQSRLKALGVSIGRFY